jgi:hypothetical protein
MPSKQCRQIANRTGRSIVSISLPKQLALDVARARHGYGLTQSEFVKMVLVEWMANDKPARRYNAPPEEYDERDE